MRYILSLVLALSLFAFNSHRKTTDKYIRDRVVSLEGAGGQCSGVQVKGVKSHETFILTASHCKVLLSQQGFMMAIDEQGKNYEVAFVAEDPSSDLMLLTGINSDYVVTADKTGKHEHIHTMTHGAGFPAYRTDGELLDEKLTPFRLFDIITQDDLNECTKLPKLMPVPLDFNELACYLSTYTMASTAMIVPGSSGGAVLNADGELIGIVSATDGSFSYLVPLSDIHAFLKDK